VEGSITDQTSLTRAFSEAKIETVFHLAAQASARPDAAPLAYTQETNFTGPRLLLDACRAHAVSRVVVASSMRLYRTPLPSVVNESSPVNPTDLVHLSHLYCEVLLAEHRRRDIMRAGKEPETSDRHQAPLRSVAARMGIIHGISPVMKTDPKFLAAPQFFCLQAARGQTLDVNTGPETELTFLHIDDAVEALMRCVDLPVDVPVVNVAAEVRSVASVAAAVQRAGAARGLDVRVDYHGEHGPDASRSIESALDSTEFRPTRRIEQSIGDVLDYYIAEGADHCASS